MRVVAPPPQVYSCRGEHALQLHRDIRAGAVHRWPQSLRLLRCPKLCLFHAVGVVDACSSCGGISHRPSLGLGVVREGELGGGHHGHDGLRLCRHRGRAAFSLDGVARRHRLARVERVQRRRDFATRKLSRVGFQSSSVSAKSLGRNHKGGVGTPQVCHLGTLMEVDGGVRELPQISRGSCSEHPCSISDWASLGHCAGMICAEELFGIELCHALLLITRAYPKATCCVFCCFVTGHSRPPREALPLSLLHEFPLG